MPSVMIYIRQQDYDRWLAVADKPQFIHDMLNLPIAHRTTEKPKPTRITKPEQPA